MRTPTIDFVGKWRTWAALSAILVLLSVGSLVFRGLDLSMDFVGGSSYRLEQVRDDLDAQQLRQAAEGAGAVDVTAQLQLDGERVTGAVVRTESLEPGSELERAVRAAVTEVSEAEEVGFEFVGPVWGQRITRQALEALVVFLVIVMIYISVRLELKMAIGAIVATAHDVLITIGIYALVGFPVSPATVIAILTILGYSLYDTVVVFDRVKDNSPFLGEPGFRDYGELVNTSMNQVLYRSLSTSITSLLPVGALLIIGSQLLGATTLQDLALALFIGLTVGIYSSLFVAAPLYAWLRTDGAIGVRDPEAPSRRGRRPLPPSAAENEVQPSADVEPDASATAEQQDPDRSSPTDTPVAGSAEARRPITTDYVRGTGRGNKRRGKR